MAAPKIEGLVVTPTTPEFAIRDGSECASLPEILALDRSSSQMDVPPFATSTTDIYRAALILVTIASTENPNSLNKRLASADAP